VQAYLLTRTEIIRLCVTSVRTSLTVLLDWPWAIYGKYSKNIQIKVARKKKPKKWLENGAQVSGVDGLYGRSGG
jgi:hypothetical protein